MGETTDPAVVRDLLADAQRQVDEGLEIKRLQAVVDQQRSTIGAAWEVIPDWASAGTLAEAIDILVQADEDALKRERALGRAEVISALASVDAEMIESDRKPHLPTVIAALRVMWQS